MPGPPTPISGCPLKRWEIREGSSTRVYQSLQPHNMFTLSIEGEEPVDSDTATLIFLIHLGPRQLISIRLHDLLRTYGGPTDIVNIEKQRYEICVKIPGQNRAVVAQFEEERDFAMAVYMFKRSRLPVNDSIPHPFPTSAMTPPPNNSLGYQSASHIGPRLSSITPLPQFLTSSMPPNLGQEAPASFTELWNPFMSFPRPGSSPESPPQNLQRLHSLPTYASASSGSHFASDTITQQLNPYNMFLGRSSSRIHTPRVGSPLKQSFYPEVSESQSPISSTELNPHLNVAHFPYNAYDSSPQHSASSGPRDSPHPGEGLQVLKNDEHEQGQSATTLPQAASFEAGLETPQKDTTKNFRDLMPTPRQLPFDSGPKHVVFATETPSKVPVNTSTRETMIQPPASAPLTEATPKISPEVAQTKSPTKILAQESITPSITRTGAKNSTRASTRQTATKISTPKPAKETSKKISAWSRRRTQAKTLSRITSRDIQVRPRTRAFVRNESKTIADITTRTSTKETSELELRRLTSRASGQESHVDDTAMTGDGVSPLREQQLKSTMNSKVQTDPAFKSPGFPSSPNGVIDSLLPSLRAPVDCNLTVLLTNPEILRELDRLTSKYFEQYSADVETGSDERSSAWFYMDCIMNARREFWLKMLEEVAFNQPFEESERVHPTCSQLQSPGRDMCNGR